MAIGNAGRRQERRPRITATFAAADVEAALDLLHLADLAWHDCFGPRELELSAAVLDDVLLLADGDLAGLIRTSLSAVQDSCDVRVAADRVRASRSP